MSTNDVPGANPTNADTLHMGCWGEHEDGSLIFVKSTEGDRVIYEMYDPNQTPILFFQDAMVEDGFKKKYSWDPTNPNKSFGKWTWHDKSAFPWDTVIKAARPGLQHASAADQLSAAQKVADALSDKPTAAQLVASAVGATPSPVDPAKLSHMLENMGPRGKFMMSKIQAAISMLPPDEAVKEIAKEIAAAN